MQVLSRRVALVLASALIPGCLQGSFSSGTLGDRVDPWEFRTQYAYWDAKEFNQQGNTVYIQDRPDDRGGLTLKLRLFGFTFNPMRDRRTWNTVEWRQYNVGIETQPHFTLSVERAAALRVNDTVEYHRNPDQPLPSMTGPSPDDGVVPTGPALTVHYSPGSPVLAPNAEYPGRVLRYASEVHATVKFLSLPAKAIPGAELQGIFDYSLRRAEGDPDDAVTGSVKVYFAAQLVGERLAECNEATSLWGATAIQPDPCDELAPGAEGP